MWKSSNEIEQQDKKNHSSNEDIPAKGKSRVGALEKE